MVLQPVYFQYWQTFCSLHIFIMRKGNFVQLIAIFGQMYIHRVTPIFPKGRQRRLISTYYGLLPHLFCFVHVHQSLRFLVFFKWHFYITNTAQEYLDIWKTNELYTICAMKVQKLCKNSSIKLQEFSIYFDLDTNFHTMTIKVILQSVCLFKKLSKF